MSTKTVVFDLGEVLSVSPPHLAQLAEVAGVPESNFAEQYWVCRNAYDLGQSPAAYWRQVVERSGAQWRAALESSLTAVDNAAWTTLTDDGLGLLQELSSQSIPLGLLSNAPLPLAQAVRAASWSSHFQALVFSSECRVMKPDLRIYERAQLALEADESDDLIFFDDRQSNIDGALSAGWRAHLWTSSRAAREVLEAEGILHR